MIGSTRRGHRDRWRPVKDTEELDLRLPGAITGIGNIVLDDARLEKLIPNDRIREIVIRREVKKFLKLLDDAPRCQCEYLAMAK